MLLDTHFHYDFLTPELRPAVLEALGARGVRVVAQTLEPSAYEKLRASTSLPGINEPAVQDAGVQKVGMQKEGARNVYRRETSESSPATPLLSLGLHPWWITSREQAEAELDIFDQQVRTTRFIGEIGLDLLPRRLETASENLQVETLRRLLASVREAAAQQPANQPYVLSLHAVRGTSALLDTIEELELTDYPIVPVVHRFGGTSDELTRFIALGGSISVHPTLLGSKRGRACIRQVPAGRLLLETDLPEQPIGALDPVLFAQQVHDALHATLDGISAERREDFLPTLLANQAQLYSL